MRVKSLKVNLNERPAILYFGNDWFAENRTSSHQIARCLARNGFQVYYLECPGLRSPKGTGRDLKKLWAKLVRFFRGTQTVDDGLQVRTLLQVPLHRFALTRWLNRTLIVWTVRWLLWRHGVRRPIAWFLLPHLAPVVGRLGEGLSVYYCTDDYSAMPDVDSGAIRSMDEQLTREADFVFVTSDTLLGPKLRLNSNTRVSPHGVDFDHFAGAQDPALEVPPDVDGLSHPVVGFFGLIERWIDLDLINYLAERRPHYTFAMIGRVAVPADELPRRPNIHYLGKRPYDTLPAYAKSFDACIIPYRLNRQVFHANPLKLREYLATGKPVVSVSTPEIEKFADVVAIAHSREEFLERLDQAINEAATYDEVKRRMDRVAPTSWEATMHKVLEVLGLVRGQISAAEETAMSGAR
jgi:glycosyltransferase involved in cell wall biosynthesis